MCDCSNTRNNEVVVDCSQALLVKVPRRLPASTSIAIFTNHKLTVIPSKSFIGCSQLKSLDVSNGILRKLPSSSLKSLSALKSLALNNNKLDFTKTSSVESGIFDDLSNLANVKLENNMQSIIQESSTRNDLFAKVVTLRTLSVDFPSKVTLAGNITWMLQLEKLEIYGSLIKVSNDTFAAINQTNISYLGIHSQVFQDVDALAFEHFPHLQVLNLSHTSMLGFINISKAWHGLKYKPLKVLDLTRIAPYERDFVTIKSNFFQNLNYTNITELYIDINNILTIESGVLHGLPKLNRLSMTNNRISLFFNVWLEFSALKYLRFVDASFQLKRILSRRETNLLPSYFSTNATTQLKNSLRYLSVFSNDSAKQNKSDVLINISKNQFNSIPDVFELKTFPIVLPRCLEDLNMAQTWSEKLDETPKIFFLGRSRLKIFNYSSNGFAVWNKAIRIAIPPIFKVTFDMSKNGCKQMSPEVFRHSCQYFNRLFLANNQLGTSLSADVNGSLFASCHELIVLDLADNNIKQLPRNVFLYVQKLQYLNLSSNSLRTLNAIIPNLKVLDLSSNLITFLGSDDLQIINTVKNITIDLTDNPFVCDCHSLPFLQWASKTKTRLLNFNNYNCFFDDGNYSNIFETFQKLDSLILPRLTVTCSSAEYLKYAFVLATLILLATLMALWVNKYYWEIKFCLDHFSYQRRNYMRLIEQQQADRYTYAAFVSFAFDDYEWVVKQMKTSLESPDCKLYIYPEQFLSGFIEDNIMQALEQCRKIILILSRHFVNSDWCRVEAHMAFQRCIKTGFDLIIPVLLEEIPSQVNVAHLEHIFFV